VSGAADFRHRFVPGTRADGLTLLLLHGTGGNEDDLIGLGGLLAPGAALLSPRGKVLENGMPRFFRRLAEGVFDHEDLVARTHELAAWVDAAAAEYGFDRGRIVAAGFSNGANVAASLMLMHPETLAGGVLFRAMVPFEPDRDPALGGLPVLIGAGRADPIVPAENSERLAELLRRAGANVTLDWRPGGHSLARPEVDDAARWLAAAFPEGAAKQD
jgi:phospholipase/carboxylesterase